ncbi:MAG: type II toxin-antitoxin system PemK/MazF family toxin [Sulfuricella sp.]
MADQIMTTDKQRLKAMLGKLTRDEMKTIERVLKIQLGIPL